MGIIVADSRDKLIFISSGIEDILDRNENVTESGIEEEISSFEQQGGSGYREGVLKLGDRRYKCRQFRPEGKFFSESQQEGRYIKSITVLDKFTEADFSAKNAFQNELETLTTSEEVDRLKEKLKKLQKVFDNAYEALVIVDPDGYITDFNNAYEECLGLEAEEVKGKHVTEVIDNTRLHVIAESGEAEIGHLQNIQGEDMITSRIPLKEDGELIGVAGKILFENTREVKALAQRLEVIEDELDEYKNELKRRQKAKYTFSSIITRNERMEYLKEIAENCASSNSTVLINGESGTGKEMFAHAIHSGGARKYGAFVRVNCAAIPENLLESELFGYEEGAFTGAKETGKPGKFELADGGTIFLDEITSMPLEMQAKILRVLQEREIQRVGGTETKKIDTRVIAATNEDVESLVAEGKFRQDLYYRLNVIRLQIPPLRKRKEDISILSDHILAELAERLNEDRHELSPRALELLEDYDWPGNVRELYNFLERAINLSSGKMIEPKHLPDILTSSAGVDDTFGTGTSDAGKKAGTKSERTEFKKDDLKSEDAVKIKEENLDLSKLVRRTEKRCIRQALAAAGGNKTEAARILGIHRNTLYNKLDKFGIQD